MFTTLVLRSPLLTPQFLETLFFLKLEANKRLNLKEPDALTEMIIRSCLEVCTLLGTSSLFCIAPDGTIMSQSCHHLNYSEHKEDKG